MTNKEIVEGLEKLRSVHNGSYAPYIDKAITAIKQEKALQNRCYVSSQGLVCAFCPMECEHKGE